MGDPEDYDEHGDFAEDMDEYDPMDDCALGDDGQCGHAGSEFCDFECPMRDSDRFAGSKAWRERHRRKQNAAPTLLDGRTWDEMPGEVA